MDMISLLAEQAAKQTQKLNESLRSTSSDAANGKNAPHTSAHKLIESKDFNVAHADDASEEHDAAYAKHIKTHPELAKMHWMAAKHWNNAARAYDEGKPDVAQKHTNRAADFENKIREHKIKHGISLNEETIDPPYKPAAAPWSILNRTKFSTNPISRAREIGLYNHGHAVNRHFWEMRKHKKTNPELSDLHDKAYEAHRSAESAYAMSDLANIPAKAAAARAATQRVEDYKKKMNIKESSGSDTNVLREGKEDYMHDSTPGRRDTLANKIKYTTGDKSGTYAVLKNGKKYKLDAKTLNHVMPKVGSVLDTTKHTLVEDAKTDAMVKYHVDTAAKYSRKFFKTLAHGAHGGEKLRAYALAHNAHRNAAAAHKKGDSNSKQLSIDAIKASDKANALSPLKEAVLNTKTRNALKSKQFALPKERAYPIEDKAHAVNAKARAKQQLDKGNLTQSQYNEIVSKANRKLGE